MIIAARFVLPVSGPPIESGAVQFAGGIITAVGYSAGISRKSGEELVDYGDAVILPGLVNAHTHLELTHLAGQVPPTPHFSHWLSRLMRKFAEHPPTQASVTAAVREGARQSLAAGVTAVGDITRFPAWSRTALAASPLQGVSFGEIVAAGTRREFFHDRLEAAKGAGPCTLAQGRLGESRWESGPENSFVQPAVQIALSPHSPYTVEENALRRCAAEAARLRYPVCIHAAESREELEFLRTGRGPLREFLESVGIWDDRIPIPGCSPIELLNRVGLLTRRTLLAHCNYVTDDDIALIAKSGAAVVYCPRTHAAFGHPPHRFSDMLAAGINVCLGTDSLASNPSLSLLEEIQFLRRLRPDISAQRLLDLGTRNGAKALKGPTATLQPGGAMIAVVLGMEKANTWETVLSNPAPILAVFHQGQIKKEERP